MRTLIIYADSIHIDECSEWGAIENNNRSINVGDSDDRIVLLFDTIADCPIKECKADEEIKLIFHAEENPSAKFGLPFSFTASFGSGGYEALGQARTIYINIIESLSDSEKLTTTFNEAWAFFLPDYVLEAKLNLLHACLAGQVAKCDIDLIKKLPLKLKEHDDITNVEDFLKARKIDKSSKETVTTLRIALLGE